MQAKAPISYDDAIRVIHRLLEMAEQRHVLFEEPIVMVGGTAMAAHHIRKLSYDVDLYVQNFSDDVVYQVEQEFKRQFGDDFKIDVTSVENIWGNIMLRDIHLSEPAIVVHFGSRDITIRKLGLEDLFLLKLDTGREKDQDDLFVLYEKTSVDALIERFNVIWKWHGNRDAVVGYTDRFVAALCQFGDTLPRDVIARLTLPEYVLKLLYESWSQPDDPAI